MNTTTTTNNNTFAGKTSTEWRQMAKDCYTCRDDSFNQCDTDGFMSQWSEQQLATRYLDCAEIADNGGTIGKTTLFDLDGNIVPAREIETRYGWAWALLDTENPDGKFLGFFNESEAQNEKRRITANAKKGFYVGTVLYRAELNTRTGRPEATEEIAEIADNGK